MSEEVTGHRSWIRRLFCCFTATEQRQVVNTATLHSISPPLQPLSPPPSPEIKSGLESKLGDTLRLTVRSSGEGKDMSLEGLLKNLSNVEGGETARGPLYSVSTEMVSVEPNSVPEIDSLKFKALPPPGFQERAIPRKGLPPLPLKPITPSSFHGRIRIPTARPHRPSSLRPM